MSRIGRFQLGESIGIMVNLSEHLSMESEFRRFNKDAEAIGARIIEYAFM